MGWKLKMDPPISLTWRHLPLRDPALPRNPNDFVPGHPRHEANGFLPPPAFISFPGQTRCLGGAMWGSLLVKAPSRLLSSGSPLGWVTHLSSPVLPYPQQARFVHLSLCPRNLLCLLGNAHSHRLQSPHSSWPYSLSSKPFP